MSCLIIDKAHKFEKNLFEFDVPDNYESSVYQGMYAFSDTTNEDRGFIIYARENRNIKKSVWDISQSDLNDLSRSIARTGTSVETEKRVKLGKEKAAKMILSDGDSYVELYVLASNKYIYLVTFVGETEADLNNSDYEMVKKSFKLKDATTNFRLLYVIVALIVIGVSAYLKYRKSSVHSNYSNHKKQETIDYKNLTEDDFKNM